MYCYVIFGESADKHTRKYLYKCTKKMVAGEVVLVPAKNATKVAMIQSTFARIPDEIRIDPGGIKSVISKSDKKVEANVARSFFLALIDEYKDADIARKELCAIVKCFLAFSEIKLNGNSQWAQIINVQLPEVCLCNTNESGESDEKELRFWKELKDIEYKLRYGHSFWKRPKSRIGYINEDPIEYTDEYLQIELELKRLIRSEIGEGGYRGFCHKYWLTKKNILKDRFNIEWKSPADLNPQIWFD